MNRRDFEYEDASSRCREQAEERECQAEAMRDFLREERLLESQADDFYTTLDKEPF